MLKLAKGQNCTLTQLVDKITYFGSVQFRVCANVPIFFWKKNKDDYVLVQPHPWHKTLRVRSAWEDYGFDARLDVWSMLG